MNSVIFVSSGADAQYALNLVNKIGPDRIKIICNFPPALKLLSEHNLKATDSQSYFPVNEKSLADYQKIVLKSQILSQSDSLTPRLTYRQYRLGDILGYGLAVYLAEVKHSFLVAAEILRREKPRKIYVSSVLTESPMKTYQSGNLNCENTALLELARKQNIEIIEISNHKISNSWKILTLVARQLAGSFVYSIKQLLATGKQIKISSNVFLANHYQLANLRPVIESFVKKTNRVLVIGKADDNLSQSIIKRRIPFLNYSSQVPQKTNIADLKLILTLKYLFLWHKHRRILQQEFHESWPLIKLKLFYYYLILIPQTIETLNFADSIFDQHPKVLFTTATNDVFSKCFALSAKQHGTKVIEIQHGLLITDIDAPFRCNDIYAVWGKDVIPLLDQTQKPQNSKIVGYPYSVNPPNHQEQKILANSGRRKLGISPNEKVILLLGAFPITITRFFSPVSTLGFINLLIKGISATQKSWTIVIRPHPSYNPDWINNIPLPKSIKIIVDERQVPLSEAVAASNIVIANHTTAILEALIQKKPLLLYLFIKSAIESPELHPLIASGIAPLFQTANQLTELLKKMSADNYLVDEKNIANFLDNYFSLPPKVATTQNLFNLINQIKQL